MKNGEEIFLYCIAVISLIFALWNSIQVIQKRGRTNQTVGTISSIVSPNPDTAKCRNSKWAKLTYRVNGQNYTSENRIQVPMSSEIGSKIKIRYDITQPNKLYSYSLSRVFVALVIALVCMIAAIFHLG